MFCVQEEEEAALGGAFETRLNLPSLSTRELSNAPSHLLLALSFLPAFTQTHLDISPLVQFCWKAPLLTLQIPCHDPHKLSMPVYDPTPDVWTIKFKNARTTVVLYVYQLQSLQSIKVELLHALMTGNPSGQLNGATLPDSPNDIELAKPRDLSNPGTSGWQSIELDTQADDFDADLFGGDQKSKGKGKAKANGSSHKDSPLGAGLKDNAIVAFRFRGQKTVSRPVGDDVDEGLGLEDDAEPGSDGWNVELPRFEDVYGLNDLVPDDQLLTPKADKFTWAA
jgi:hypothetical protein